MKILVNGRKYKNIETKKESYIIDELIEDKITIDKTFVSYRRSEFKTAFKEIVPIQPDILYDFNQLSNLVKDRDESKILNFQDLVVSLTNYIDENWDIKKINLILHSSGLDSRIISYLIHKVYLKRGGTVKFVSLKPESNYCQPILTRVGWNKNQLIEGDALKDNFNFYTLWKSINGVSGYPINIFQYVIDNFIDDSKNYKIWAGLFFNETFESKISVQDFITRMYYHRHFAFLGSIINKPEMIFPIMNLESLKLIFESKFCDNNRLELLKYLDPSLFNLPKIEIDEIFKYYFVPQDLFSKLKTDVKKSFYYKNIDNTIIFNSVFRRNQITWTKITLASFIEHLLERNVKILW